MARTRKMNSPDPEGPYPTGDKVPPFEMDSDPDLANLVMELLTAPYEQYGLFVHSRERHKSSQGGYQNRNHQLPKGDYVEIKVIDSTNPRRVIINSRTGDIFVTPDHYKTFYYAGRR